MGKRFLCYALSFVLTVCWGFPALAFPATSSDAVPSYINPDWEPDPMDGDTYQDFYDEFMDDIPLYNDISNETSDETVSADVYLVVSECRDLLESCVSFLFFCDMFLGLLIGCVCFHTESFFEVI